MYPDPNVPLWEIPKISPKNNGYYLWVYPQESLGRTQQIPLGYTYVRGTPNCPLICARTSQTPLGVGVEYQTAIEQGAIFKGGF